MLQLYSSLYLVSNNPLFQFIYVSCLDLWIALPCVIYAFYFTSKSFLFIYLFLLQRLRESFNVPQTVTLQSKVPGRKKRKRTETLSILIKNSCKKLEKEMSILPIKKMKKLDRVLSTVSSTQNITSTQTVTSVRDSWTVTERIDNTEIKNDEGATSTALNTSQDWTITNLLIAEEDELLKNQRVTVKESDCNISQFESEEILNKSANNERDSSILEDARVTESHPQKANNRKSRVSFASELVSCVTYEIDVNNPTTLDSKEIPVDVPLSAVKSRPGILKQNINYSIVDFSSSCHAMNDVQEQVRYRTVVSSYILR